MFIKKLKFFEISSQLNAPPHNFPPLNLKELFEELSQHPKFQTENPSSFADIHKNPQAQMDLKETVGKKFKSFK